MSPRRAAARTPRGDSGVSLAELLVTMMVFAILLAMTAGFMIAATRASGQARAIDASTRTVSTAMDAVTRNLRAATNNPVKGQTLPAPAFETATANEVRFYAYVNLASTDATPVLVRYWLDAGTLRETTTRGVATSDGYWSFSGTGSTRVLATSVVAGSDVFTYLDASSTAVDTASLSLADQRRLVAAVRVRLQVGTSASSPTATTLVNTVALPNLDLLRSAP